MEVVAEAKKCNLVPRVFRRWLYHRSRCMKFHFTPIAVSNSYIIASENVYISTSH
jgi:hypothetical protein